MYLCWPFCIDKFINHTYYAIILLGIIIVMDMLFG